MPSHVLRTFVVAAFLAALQGNARAVSTNTIPLTQAWTDLGPGPLELQASNQSIVVAISDTTPSLAAGFSFSNALPHDFQTTSHIWARSVSMDGNGSVTIASITPSGSTPVPAASGTGGTSGVMLGTSVVTAFIPAASSLRRSMTVTNQANPSTGATVTLCPSGVTPGAYAPGCYTFGPGGWYMAPANGYVPQDAFSAVASQANTPVTIDLH